MRKLILIAMLAMLAGCAGTRMDVRTDVNSGATVVDSETLGVGFFTVEAKTIFSWYSDAPDAVRVTVYLTGTKNISDLSFNLGKKEIKLHTDRATIYRNSGSYSKNYFMLSWTDFMVLANAAAAGEIKMLVTGSGNTYQASIFDERKYKSRLLPFIDEVNELKRYRSPIS